MIEVDDTEDRGEEAKAGNAGEPNPFEAEMGVDPIKEGAGPRFRYRP
jgi:hypothetical protein